MTLFGVVMDLMRVGAPPIQREPARSHIQSKSDDGGRLFLCVREQHVTKQKSHK